MRAPGSTIAHAFAIGNALIGVAAASAVLVFDVRSHVVQLGTALVAGLLFASSFGLFRATRWRWLALRASAYLGLAAGLCALTALVFSAADLSAAHIGLGAGGLQASSTLTTSLVLALLLPYLLLYPALQLLWAHRQQHAESPPPAATAASA